MREIRFRLGKGVTVVEQDHDFVMLMKYPLKVISLPLSLAPIWRQLKTNDDTSLEDLAGLAPDIGKQALESFLYKLEKRGVIESSALSLPSPLPKVSIVIPVRNRPHEIRTCLRSLCELDYPEERLQIIVVDDASDDDTASVAEIFPVTVHKMRERQGASLCRNWGGMHSEGDIICFLDSDCVADRDWLTQLLPLFREPNVGAAGGLVDAHDDKTALDRYEKVKSPLIMGRHCTDSSMGSRFFYVPSCNLAVRRDCFLEVGGFNEGLEVGEDVDLCWRIINKGYVIEYRPSARVLHHHRNNVGSFCWRRFEYGTSEPILQSLHQDRRKTFTLWPKALAFWSLLLTAVFSGVWALGFLAVFLILTDTVIRWRRVAKLGATLNPLLTLAAVIRSNFSFLYHCSSFISRYYLIWATVLTPVFPLIGAITWTIHLGVGTVEFLVKKPRLNPCLFLGIFSLEQVFYQAGVWFGCFKQGFCSPVFPRIAVKLAGSEDPPLTSYYRSQFSNPQMSFVITSIKMKGDSK